MRQRRIGKTITLMIVPGIALGWAAILLIPTAISLGMPPAPANKIPYLGFILGVAWGLCLHFSASAKAALQYIGCILLLGAVFWFFAVLAGGILVGLGIPPAVADYIPLAAFCVGAVLGSVPMFVAGYEGFDALRARIAAKSRT